MANGFKLGIPTGLDLLLRFLIGNVGCSGLTLVGGSKCGLHERVLFFEFTVAGYHRESLLRESV